LPFPEIAPGDLDVAVVGQLSTPKFTFTEPWLARKVDYRAAYLS
jgi:hypothetical protein